MTKERDKEKQALKQRLQEIEKQEAEERDAKLKASAARALVNSEFLLDLLPGHDGEHTDANFRDHDEHCRRCFILMARNLEYWDPERELIIGIMGVG